MRNSLPFSIIDTIAAWDLFHLPWRWHLSGLGHGLERNEGAAMRKQVCRQLAGTNWRPIYAGYRGVLTG